MLAFPNPLPVPALVDLAWLGAKGKLMVVVLKAETPLPHKVGLLRGHSGFFVPLFLPHVTMLNQKTIHWTVVNISLASCLISKGVNSSLILTLQFKIAAYWRWQVGPGRTWLQADAVWKELVTEKVFNYPVFFHFLAYFHLKHTSYYQVCFNCAILGFLTSW